MGSTKIMKRILAGSMAALFTASFVLAAPRKSTAAAVDEPALYKQILGAYASYGILADVYIEQNHTQTSMLVGTFDGNNVYAQSDLSNIPGPVIAGTVTSGNVKINADYRS